MVTTGDHDFVSPELLSDDTSINNITTCIVEGDEENAIKCEVKKEETGEAYRMWVSLKKHIDNIEGDSYSFQLKAQVR